MLDLQCGEEFPCNLRKNIVLGDLREGVDTTRKALAIAWEDDKKRIITLRSLTRSPLFAALNTFSDHAFIEKVCSDGVTSNSPPVLRSNYMRVHTRVIVRAGEKIEYSWGQNDITDLSRCSPGDVTLFRQLNERAPPGLRPLPLRVGMARLAESRLPSAQRGGATTVRYWQPEAVRALCALAILPNYKHADDIPNKPLPPHALMVAFCKGEKSTQVGRDLWPGWTLQFCNWVRHSYIYNLTCL